MVIDLRVEIALHDIFLVVPIVCACPAAWGIENLHQTAAVEEEPCPSAVCSMSPRSVGAVELASQLFSSYKQVYCSFGQRKKNFFLMSSDFFSNFVCVLITVDLKHMQKGRFQNIKKHFQNRASSRGFFEAF